MARKASLTELAGKATLNAQPYVDGLKSMDAATKRTTAGMDSTWDKFARGFSKKWNAKSFGSQVAKGLGIGSGFAILDKGADAISGQWEKAADLAKFVEDSTAKQFALAKEAMAARRTDLQNQMMLEKEIARTNRELQGEKAKPFEFDWTKPGQYGEQFQSWLAGMNVSPEQQKRIQELTTALYELGKAKAQLDEKIEKSKTSANLSWTAQLGAGQARRFAADAMLNEVENGPDTAGERAKKIAQYEKERAFYLNQISKLGPTDAKNTEIKARMENYVADATERLIPLLQRENQLANSIGDAFASSFEEAVFAGEKLSEMLQNLAKDIARLAFRELITAPLAGMFSSGLKGLFRAEGGPVTAGAPYIVGERGPELFVPSSSGRINPDVPSGKGGGTYYIDARGADRTGLAKLEAAIVSLHGSIEQRAVAAVVDAKRRRLIPAV